MSKATAATAEYQDIPIEKLHPSKLNPRKHFDKKRMAELEASVRTHGVMTPILVRPNAKGFEIAAGERRYRASKAAGIITLPARVREMDDVMFLEVMTIENLQREDIHPLEEADGYRALIKTGKYDVDGVAAKIGKSASYVYQRLKLTDLIEATRKLFLEETITAGHAILLARLQPADQEKCLNNTADLLYRYYSQDPKSVRDFSDSLKTNLYLDLNRAAFDKKQVDLTKAGPCTTCPKRSGANPSLFDDIEAKNICTDRKCFGTKMSAHMRAVKAAHPEAVQVTTRYVSKPKDGVVSLNQGSTEVKKASGRCKDTVEGILADGDRKGRVIQVCPNRECKKHNRHSHHSHQESDASRKEQERYAIERLATRQSEIELYKAIKNSSGTDLPIEMWRILAESFSDDLQEEVVEAWGFGPNTGEQGESYAAVMDDLDKFLKDATHSELVAFTLACSITYNYQSRDKAMKIAAESVGLDLKAVEKAAKKAIRAERRQKEREKAKAAVAKKTPKEKPVQTSAKKKTTKKKTTKTKVTKKKATAKTKPSEAD